MRLHLDAIQPYAAWPYSLPIAKAPEALREAPELTDLRSRIREDLEGRWGPSLDPSLRQLYRDSAASLIVALAGEDKKVESIQDLAISERRILVGGLSARNGRKIHRLHEQGLGVVLWPDIYRFAGNRANYRLDHNGELAAPTFNKEEEARKVAKYVLSKDLTAAYKLIHRNFSLETVGLSASILLPSSV